MRDWRAQWADLQNEHLRRHLGPDAPQVSHLSLAEQGIDRAPTEHLGPRATALERKNERGADNELVSLLASNLQAGRTFAFQAEMEKKVAALTPEQVSAAFRKYVDPNRLVIVQAGDFKKSQK